MIRGRALNCGVVFALLVGIGSARAAEAKGAGAKIDFNRDIRPLLSDRCFKCHGPDAGSRKAKLRLDRAEDAYAERKSHGHAIVPGQTERSLVCQRIFSADPEEMMPPPESHLALSRPEKE